ncbi:MAG TPA: nucleotidyltransferase family protein [Chloroflexota bacterium]
MRGIILAGGRGERLMPLTADRPKCLVEVAGRPLIAHQLRWLHGQGVRQVVISCGYRWQAIQEVVGGGPDFGLEVSYAVEDEPLGRGGGLRKALRQMPASPEPVVACNGDLITNLPLKPMLRRHRRAQALATLLLVPFVSQHGVVDLDGSGRVTGFREKPSLPYWLSGGVYILSPDIARRLPAKGDHELTTWRRLAAEGRLHGHPYRGFWQPVDSAKDVAEASRRLARSR